MPRHARLLLLLAVFLVATLGAPANVVVAREPVASSASRQGNAAYPKPPGAGYSPRHVRQLFNNCAFASAQMLIDKWSEGRRRAPQHLLRRATGILPEEGGPTLAQLRRAVARVSGIDMRWSPNGGDPLTWPDLLSRLEDGGGAVVNVWPAKLPPHYRRWLPGLTAGHSVYVERYDFAKNRVWLMDPLGRGSGFRGEWINADVLHRAMWHSGSLVWAAATPAPGPRPPALSDFQLQEPEVPATAFSDDSISITIGYSARRLRATLPTLHLAAGWEPIAGATVDPQPEAPEPEAPEPEADSFGEDDHVALSRTVEPGMPDGLEPPSLWSSDEPESTPLPGSVPVTVGPKLLQVDLPTPSQPGDYLLRLELLGDDDEPAFTPVVVRVRGPLAGRIQSVDGSTPVGREGDMLPLAVRVSNLGSSAWGPGGQSVALTAAFASDVVAAAEPLEVASGEAVLVPLSVRVDTHPGLRTLRLNLVDDDGLVIPESAVLEITVEIAAADLRVAEFR